MFNPDKPKLSKGIVCELPYPTGDTRLVIHTALAGLDHIYRTGYAYAKAEILLMDLRQPGEFTEDLFAEVQPAAAARVMGGAGSDQRALGKRYPKGSTRY